jgi:hypothetical protein
LPFLECGGSATAFAHQLNRPKSLGHARQAPEARQKLAPGVSPGTGSQKHTSTGGAADSPQMKHHVCPHQSHAAQIQGRELIHK